MEPKIIVLDAGTKVHELKKVCAEGVPYLYDYPRDICSNLVRCATNRVAPYGELIKYVAKIKHGSNENMPQEMLVRLTTVVGDLGFSLIESMKRLKTHDIQLEEDEWMPYHFHSARRNVVVLAKN